MKEVLHGKLVCNVRQGQPVKIKCNKYIFLHIPFIASRLKTGSYAVANVKLLKVFMSCLDCQMAKVNFTSLMSFFTEHYSLM